MAPNASSGKAHDRRDNASRSLARGCFQLLDQSRPRFIDNIVCSTATGVLPDDHAAKVLADHTIEVSHELIGLVSDAIKR
jgi:hypothetical protein